MVLGPLLIGVALALHLSSRGPETTPAAAAPVAEPASTAARTQTGRATRRALNAPPPTDGSSSIVWIRPGRTIEVFDAPRGEVVATQGDETEFGAPSVFAVERRKEGWFGISTPLVPNGAVGWIRNDPHTLRGGYVEYSIDVDLSSRSASLAKRGREIRSWQITIGAPASPTPTGEFAVTDTFRGGLNPSYGCCALALSATQPNLPTTWLGGNRIAIHGTDGPLGTAVSNGCIHSADDVVDELVSTIPLGTPVSIHD